MWVLSPTDAKQTTPCGVQVDLDLDLSRLASIISQSGKDRGKHVRFGPYLVPRAWMVRRIGTNPRIMGLGLVVSSHPSLYSAAPPPRLEWF